MITTSGELVGVIGLLDDGPPFRLTTVVSYGRSEVLELTKEAFDHCCKLNHPDVYKCVQDMARSELAAPGNKDAFIAMRSRSMRRCAYMKGRTRKDPLTGKPLLESRKSFKVEDKNKVGDKSKVEDKNKSQAFQPPPPNKAASEVLDDAGSLVDDSIFQYRSLAKRMDAMEDAMRDLTSLVAKIYDTLNNDGAQGQGQKDMRDYFS